jgi:hypothetical protein
MTNGSTIKLTDQGRNGVARRAVPPMIARLRQHQPEVPQDGGTSSPSHGIASSSVPVPGSPSTL